MRRSAAEVLCDEAPARFADLERLGVRFDADRHGQLALGLEGGHSVRRVVHAGGSATGRRILRQLSANVVEDPRIEVLEDRRVRALLTVDGRVTGVATDDGRALQARAVILASGGAAALWSRTTNPPGSFGSGLLLARAVGAELADLEFVQFHPTAVVGVKGREGFLVTEAIRGEGATLHDAAGDRFVDELAPRDAVAKAIHTLLVGTGAPAVYLDMTHIDPARFPNVVTALREAGLDPATERIPVSPASHYVMGGDHERSRRPQHRPRALRRRRGRLHRPARGEPAGLELAQRVLRLRPPRRARRARRPGRPPARRRRRPEGDLAPAPSRETRKAMWVNAGLERDAEHLRALLSDPHPLARLVAASALAREESRGAHARSEFPSTDPELDQRHSVIAAGGTTPVAGRVDVSV